MSKIKKITIWIIIIIVAGLLLNFLLAYIGSYLCKNDVIETKNSPDGTKKAVAFTRDCGATTDWSTQASVININDTITDRDVGNVIRIDSDHGKAWPIALGGWPIIITKWEISNILNIYYSKGVSILLQNKEIDGVQIEYSTITTEFIQSEGLQVR